MAREDVTSFIASSRIRRIHAAQKESLLNLECIGAVGLGRVFAAVLQLTAYFDAIVSVDAPRIYMTMGADLCTIHIKDIVAHTRNDNTTIRPTEQFGS